LPKVFAKSVVVDRTFIPFIIKKPEEGHCPGNILEKIISALTLNDIFLKGLCLIPTV
jgi:hypothetical protein